MSRPDGYEAARYARLRWNAPLDDAHADLLLSVLGPEAGEVVLDLGCGSGELLMRAVGQLRDLRPPVAGMGVDTDMALIRRARVVAAERGLKGRVKFSERHVADVRRPANRVICVGASHIWGGSEPALQALREHVRPGGRLLFGEGCWEHPPTPAAAALFEGVQALDDLVARAPALGWRVIHVSVADQREWDAFESSWRAGRQEWLLANPAAEQSGERQAELDGRLQEYLTVYRGVLGFCYLVLAPDPQFG